MEHRLRKKQIKQKVDKMETQIENIIAVAVEMMEKDGAEANAVNMELYFKKANLMVIEALKTNAVQSYVKELCLEKCS